MLRFFPLRLLEAAGCGDGVGTEGPLSGGSVEERSHGERDEN